MAETGSQVMCPACHATVAVEPEWRLAQCPRCGQMISRMSEDRSYD